MSTLALSRQDRVAALRTRHKISFGFDRINRIPGHPTLLNGGLNDCSKSQQPKASWSLASELVAFWSTDRSIRWRCEVLHAPPVANRLPRAANAISTVTMIYRTVPQPNSSGRPAGHARP